MKRKVLSVFLSLVFVLTSVSMSAFADTLKAVSFDFNTQGFSTTADYLTFAKLGTYTFADSANTSYSANGLFNYESGIYGRATDDYSEVMRIHSATPLTISGNDCYVFCGIVNGSTSAKASINDGRYYEFSVAADGANMDFQLNGSATSTYVLNSSTAWKNQQWNRITIWLNNYAVDGKYTTKVYVNGIEYKSYTSSVWRVRLRAQIPTGTTDAFVAIDDYNASAVGTNSYTPSSAPSIVFDSSDFIYNQATNEIYMQEGSGLTAADLKSAVTSDASINVYDDELVVPSDKFGSATAFKTERTNSDEIQVGDKVIFTDMAGGFVNQYYCTLISSAALNVSYDFDENDLSVTPITAGSPTIVKETVAGLYTKSATDKALKLTATRTGDAATATRVEFQKICDAANSLVGKVKSTIEFSVAVDGSLNCAEAYFYYTVDGSSTFLKPLAIESDSSITAPSALSGTENGLKKWYKIAISFDPVAGRCVTYVNGDKCNDEILFNPGQEFSINRIAANIQPGLNIGDTGILALDDIKFYFGDYNYSEAIAAPDVAFEKTGTIYAAANDYTQFMNSVPTAEGITKALYTVANGVYTAKTDAVVDGDVLVLTSSDGLLKKYYTVTTKSEFILDDAITIVPGESNITATLNGKYFKGSDATVQKAMLILAIYDGDTLVKYVADPHTITESGAVTFAAIYNEAPTSNIHAKAFLWDSLENLHPYDVAIGEYTYAEE